MELLTSLDVVNQSFKKSMRGYDAAEVDEFLDHVAETLQTYAQRTKDLERNLLLKEESLKEYERMKDVLHEALLMAQKSADDKVMGAKEEADRTIAEAREKADSICRDAVREAESLRDGIAQIRNVRTLYEQEFRGLLARFDNMLNQSISGSPLSGAVNSILEETCAQEEECARDISPEDATEAESAPRNDLKTAYSMLGVDPGEILDDQAGEAENNG